MRLGKRFLMVFNLNRYSLFVRLLVAISLIISGCSNGDSEMVTVIKGTISGLPDGTMYLFDQMASKLDSVQTDHGRFEFKIPAASFKMPAYAQIRHRSRKDSTLRMFIFHTKKKYRGGPIMTSLIMLESPSSNLIGKLSDSDYSKSIKTSSIVGDPVIGRQSQAFYDDTTDENSFKFEEIGKQIAAHPYSYHFLFKLRNVAHKFSSVQLARLVDRFNKEVQSSEVALSILKNARDTTLKVNRSTRFLNEFGEEKSVLESGKLNMVVLWASWCGPCRKEIPQLKSLYYAQLANKKFNMVSVSIDAERGMWVKALKKENMPWRQVILSDEQMKVSQQIFNFDGSIPLILFYNDKGDLLRKMIGFSEDNFIDIDKFIAKNSG